MLMFIHTIHTVYKACQQYVLKMSRLVQFVSEHLLILIYIEDPVFISCLINEFHFSILLQIIFWLYDVCYSSRTIFIVVLSNFGDSSSCLCILMIIFLNLDIRVI